jgi:hypothetical protein
VPAWQRLAQLSSADRQNACIEFECPRNTQPQTMSSLRDLAFQWNAGRFQQAISGLRHLEQAADDLDIAIGISWRVPKVISADKWGSDISMGSGSDIRVPTLDYDENTGNLFAALQFNDGSIDRWSANISTDNGQTWSQTYAWSGSDVNWISARVGAGYFYVGYTGPGSGASTEARCRRFYLSTGVVDILYGIQVVFDLGSGIQEIALETNADYTNDRIYYFAILGNESLVFYWSTANGTSWHNYPFDITNARWDLDVHWNSGYSSGEGNLLYVTYSEDYWPAPQMHMIGISETGYDTWILGLGGHPTVSGHDDIIVTAFLKENYYGVGVWYRISYDDGASWAEGILVDIEEDRNVQRTSVTARGGAGIACLFSEYIYAENA